MPKARRPPQNRLSDLRSARGWTQGQLAAKVGVTPSTVSRWEARLSAIDDNVKDQLASILDVTTAQLMCWEPLPGDSVVVA